MQIVYWWVGRFDKIRKGNLFYAKPKSLHLCWFINRLCVCNVYWIALSFPTYLDIRKYPKIAWNRVKQFVMSSLWKIHYINTWIHTKNIFNRGTIKVLCIMYKYCSDLTFWTGSSWLIACKFFPQKLIWYHYFNGINILVWYELPKLRHIFRK